MSAKATAAGAGPVGGHESGDLVLELKMRAWSSAGVGTTVAMVVCLWVETPIFQRLGRLWKPRATETLWGALAWICRNSTEAANWH